MEQIEATMTTATLEGRCLWKIPGMPRRGWTLVDVEDLGEPEHTCEACGKTEIRYVHTIEHAAFRTLDVGCVCCEHLTGDYANPRRREQELRSAAAGRKRRAAREGLRRAQREIYRRSVRDRWESMHWRESAKGNLWLKLDGILITVFFARGGYRYVGAGYFSDETFEDQVDARMASLQLFEYLHRQED